MTVFIVALLSAVVIGMLQLNTEEIQLMRNHVYTAEALAIAEAGLNDAFAELRSDANWSVGFTNKAFEDGSYTVVVSGSPPNLTIESTGINSQGYIAQVDADVTMGSGSPHTVTIDELRMNE